MPNPDSAPAPEPIAIVGMGCRFPGGVASPRDYWKLLCNGDDAITEIPAERWSAAKFFDARRGRPGKTAARHGGFVPLDRFDAEFFGISPREAARMDPQQRLLLETRTSKLMVDSETGRELARVDDSRHWRDARFVSETLVRAIRQFPNARIEKFPAGHAVHLEMPEAFEALRALPRRDGSSGTKPGAPGVAGPRLKVSPATGSGRAHGPRAGAAPRSAAGAPSVPAG